MADPIRIGDVAIARGERVTVSLPLARLYTYADMHMPVHVIRGKQQGPTLFVCAAVHGDELNGVEIIRRLLGLKLLNRLRGTVIAVPVVNVYGFVNRTRYLPDRRDLNRSFPGLAKGSLASQLAKLFMEEIAVHCTHGIDLHTGSNHRSNLPQIRAFLGDEETARLAKLFGTSVILDATLRDGSLREATHAKGITSLLYEAGEALRFDESAIGVGLRGVLNVMRAIGQLPARKTSEAPVECLITHSSKWVRAPQSGLFHSATPLGKRVEEGELLCIVSDPGDENAKQILSPISGIVIGKLNMPLVHRGDAIFHIAEFHDPAAVTPTVDANEDSFDEDDLDTESLDAESLDAESLDAESLDAEGFETMLIVD